MKKYMHYLPHVVVAVILLMAAFGKLTGAEMPTQLFADLNLLGIGGTPSRIILGIAQVLMAIGLFSPKYEKISAVLVIINMIGAFVLVTVDPLAVVVLVFAILILLMKKMCPCCKGGKDGTCKTDGQGEMQKSCKFCEKGICDGRCGNKKEETHSENDGHGH